MEVISDDCLFFKSVSEEIIKKDRIILRPLFNDPPSKEQKIPFPYFICFALIHQR